MTDSLVTTAAKALFLADKHATYDCTREWDDVDQGLWIADAEPMVGAVLAAQAEMFKRELPDGIADHTRGVISPIHPIVEQIVDAVLALLAVVENDQQ